MYYRNRVPSKSNDVSTRSKTFSRHQPAAESLDEDLIRQAMEKPSPQTLTPDVVRQLQRRIGNQAVNQLIHRQTVDSAIIQRNPIKDKLTAYIEAGQVGEDIHDLAQHILAIINALDSENWPVAKALLFDDSVAARFGCTIKRAIPHILTDKGGGDSEFYMRLIKEIQRGMYYHEKKELVLPDVIVMRNGEYLTTEDNGDLAMRVFPVALEEWTHMFQHISGDYLSQKTYEFMQSPEAQANPGWNMREVDIYAIYRDLGWNQILDAFRSRYQERQAFADFVELQEFQEFQEGFGGNLGFGMGTRLAQPGRKKT